MIELIKCGYCHRLCQLNQSKQVKIDDKVHRICKECYHEATGEMTLEKLLKNKNIKFRKE